MRRRLLLGLAAGLRRVAGEPDPVTSEPLPPPLEDGVTVYIGQTPRGQWTYVVVTPQWRKTGPADSPLHAATLAFAQARPYLRSRMLDGG